MRKRVLWVSMLAAALVMASVVSPVLGGAQVVRGTVTQEATGAPVAGAVIELLRSDSAATRVGSVLSDVRGAFEILAPGPGRYRVSAKRIGARRFLGEPMDLAAGESRVYPIALAALDYRLPEIVVTANTLCSENPGDQARVAALWEEARTALDAAEISLRDRLFTAEVSRYVRELDPKSLRVLNESRSVVRGVVASPITSLQAESLSVGGYWRAAAGGGAQYFSPDARVLLSDVFLGDHCFRPVSGSGARKGLTGLAFAPVAGRPVPDVVGTLWMDERTFELRLVEFGYDRLRDGVDITGVGGEIHFARLANGAWLVRRWFLRVPVLGRPAQPVGTEGSSPWILVRPTTIRLSEEGGTVTTDDMRPPGRPSSIAGEVRDSSGKVALAGVVVRIGGTSRQATTDADGRFVFEALSAGPVALVANAPPYDSLGLSAADVSLELRAGERRRVTLTAHNALTITSRLCAGRASPWGTGTVHAAVRNSRAGTPVARTRATLEYMSTVGQAPGDSVLARIDGTTDDRGHVVFCEVPSGRDLTVRLVRPAGEMGESVQVTIRPREVRRLALPLDGELPNE